MLKSDINWFAKGCRLVRKSPLFKIAFFQQTKIEQLDAWKFKAKYHRTTILVFHFSSFFGVAISYYKILRSALVVHLYQWIPVEDSGLALGCTGLPLVELRLEPQELEEAHARPRRSVLGGLIV